VPLLLAGLGEAMGQRAGVLNLGVDGVMLLGAFTGYYTVLETGSTTLGLVAGSVIGLALGLVSAVMSVTLGAEQGISGIGVYLFGLGMSDLLFQRLVGTPLPIASFPRLNIPVLSDIPVLGDLLFGHSWVVYGAFAMVGLLWWVINSTTFGLNIRAVGENPEAADSLGVSVHRVRYLAMLVGGSLAGAAGAALAIDLKIFQQNLTSGAGFIAVALVYFGAWRPIGVMFGALLYGVVNGLVLHLKTVGAIPLQGSDVAAMAPAIITIVALALVANRFRQPAALTKPFLREA
jgi:simple sugar transport system permease protein